ncbi:MAG: hypothetical protein U9P73_07165 [Candidatus Cloacimonadota bacterium]|nr:hypothetical protein [Candidatus Cloacimonadota bacterium]
MKKKILLPWYAISILLTILGAISIVLLFGVYFYNDSGIVFWSILLAWITILLAASIEIGRQEKLRRTIEEEKDKLIKKLSEVDKKLDIN